MDYTALRSDLTRRTPGRGVGGGAGAGVGRDWDWGERMANGGENEVSERKGGAGGAGEEESEEKEWGGEKNEAYMEWVEEELIYEAPQGSYLNTRHHYGNRIVFDKKRYHLSS